MRRKCSIFANMMKYELINPRDIRPNPWNSNVVSHENELKLRKSIQRNGLFKPVVVRTLPDGSLECIGGIHRAEQSAELGLSEIPTINLGVIDDEKAKEISIADNARYGVDDSTKLAEILKEMDADVVEDILPWTAEDMEAITASLAVEIDDLDLDEPESEEEQDEEEEEVETKPERTHQLMRFRVSVAGAANIAQLIKHTMKQQNFTKEDDLTNAGDALEYLIGQMTND